MSSAGIVVSRFREDQVLSPVRKEHNRSFHYSKDSVLIYVTVAGSSVIPIRVLFSESIASLKHRIQNSSGVFVKDQKLVFDGRELSRNDCLVRDYGVSDGNLLHLITRLSDLQFVTVNASSGRKFEFQVEHNRNVAYIKNQIAKKGKDLADIKNLILICDGEELDDQLLINDICKSNSAVIHLLIRKDVEVRIKNKFEMSISSPKRRIDDLKIVYGESFDGPDWVEPVVVNPKVELSPLLEELISSTCAGIEHRNLPVMSSEGSGGVYFMKDGTGHKYVAVFKPVDEEPMAENNPRGLPLSLDGEGLKRGTRVGEGALREVAAYILDHPASGHRSFLSDEVGFSGVPPTVMVRCLRRLCDGIFENVDYKVGSLQCFVQNHGSCEDIGPRIFPVEEVHKIAVLDLRLANVDRHAGNILVCREGDGVIRLIPIDHGYCLPEHFEDCTFDWLFWPQARQPFDLRTLNYINSLDAEEDIAILKFYGWDLSLECSRTFRISTMLLKKGAERGLTPYDIGSILCRETIKKKSKIEEIVCEAMDTVLPGSTEASFMEAVSEIMEHFLHKVSH